jgi:opacity protein-like surface antigen
MVGGNSMNMKLASIALSGAMLVSGASFGMDFDPKFYVGAEAQCNSLKAGKLLLSEDFQDQNDKSLFRKKKSPGADMFLGMRFNENFGAEAGYSFLKKSHNVFTNANNKYVLDVKMRNAHIDAIGYLPVADDLELLGSVGLGRLSTKIQEKFNDRVLQLSNEEKKLTKTKTGIRLGLGAQYKLTENVGTRFMVRHQKGNKTIKSVNSAGLGLFYQF